MKAMATNRHSEFIQPQRPDIGDIAAKILESIKGSGLNQGEALLTAILDYFWRCFQRIEVKGLITTSESIQTSRGNCFSLSCLVASALRRLGTSEHGVAVFIGCPKDHPDLVHAYVLTVGKEPGRIAVIEPELMKAMDYSVEEFWEKYQVYCLFNDALELISQDEKQAWVAKLGGASHGAPGPEADPGSKNAGKDAGARISEGKPIQWIAYGAVNQACRDMFQQLMSQSHKDSTAKFLEKLDAESRSRIAVVPAAVMAQMTQTALGAACHYSRIISAEIEDIRRLVRCFRHSGKRLEWTDVAHILVAGLLVDLGVREQLLRSGTIREQPEDFWIWGFEGGTGAHNAFGVRLQESEGNGAVLHELWHCKSQRPHRLKIDTCDIRLLKSMSEGRFGDASVSSEDRQRALKLTFYRLSKKQNGTYIANLPVLAETDAEVVRWETSRIARLLTSQAVLPAMEQADKVYASEFFASPPDIFRHAFARLLMEHAMDRLVDEKALPAFPLQPDNAWGWWLSWTTHEQRV
jgi:hypothetical protein